MTCHVGTSSDEKHLLITKRLSNRQRTLAGEVVGEVVGTAVGVVLGASLATGSTSLAGFRGGARGGCVRRGSRLVCGSPPAPRGPTSALEPLRLLN